MTTDWKKRAVRTTGKNVEGAAYSQAIVSGPLVFVSGHGPLNPETNEFENLDIAHQTRLTLQNIQRVLAGAMCTLDDVVKATVHLRDINDWPTFNDTYKEFFTEPRPARTTVQSVLGAGISIEIDVIAVLGADGRSNANA